MAFPKKEKKDKQPAKGVNILNSPEERKRFKQQLVTITAYFRQIDDQKEGVKETIADAAAEYGLDAKTVRKLATTMYKHNYGSLQEENRHFEELYEILVEGKFRDDPGAGPDEAEMEPEPDVDGE